MKRYKKIVIAGGNGFLGSVLYEYYAILADEVIVLSRRPEEEFDSVKTVVWDGKTEGEWVGAIQNADLLINLCGKNVNCRYTKKNKEEIISSRLRPTALLNHVIGTMSAPPKVWINVTSATIYRHAEDHPQDENGDIGYGFSIEVCRKWEDEFFKTELASTRKVALRMSIVLGRGGGAFPRLLNLVKAGMGGMQGSGNQYVSWIHEHDAARVTEWILQQENISGVLNCTSPQPVKNKVFMQTIRESYGVPFGLPVPAFMLDLGASLIGTETELILKSRWVLPARLQAEGFSFQFAELGPAVNDLLSIRV